MLEAITERAPWFIAGGVTFSVALIVSGYLLCKRAYRRAARGW